MRWLGVRRRDDDVMQLDGRHVDGRSMHDDLRLGDVDHVIDVVDILVIRLDVDWLRALHVHEHGGLRRDRAVFLDRHSGNQLLL